MKKIKKLVAIAFAFCLTIVAHPVFAASTGIGAIDTAKTAATTLVTGLAGIAAVIFIGFAIWEFLAHKQLVRAGIELVCGIIIGVIAVNATSVVSTFGLSGATL